jgi:hypothetical protein
MIDHNFVVPKKKKVPSAIADDPLGTPCLSMIVGGCGSGKSTNLLNVLSALQSRHDFDSGLFVTSNNRDPLLQAVEMDITTSPAEMEKFITEVKQSKEGQNHILVLDDVQGSKDFNVMTGRSNFINFVLSHRHYGEDPTKPDRYGTWVIATAQTLKNSYSPAFRDQVRNWLLYYPKRPTEVKMYEDLAQDPTAMRRAMELVRARGKHAFLYLNKQNPEKDRYFLGYKEELIDLN